MTDRCEYCGRRYGHVAELRAEIGRLRAALENARYTIDYVQYSEGNNFSKELAAIDAALEPKP